MYNKESCRKCGFNLYSVFYRNSCNEITIWKCSSCDNVEEHIHLKCKNKTVEKIIVFRHFY